MADEHRNIDEALEQFYDSSHRAVLILDKSNKCRYASNRFWVLFGKITQTKELPQVDFLDFEENKKYKRYIDSVRVFGVCDQEHEIKIGMETKYFKVVGESRKDIVLIEIFDISDSKRNSLLVKKARKKIASINLSYIGVILGIVGFLSTSIGIYKEYLNQKTLEMQLKQVSESKSLQKQYLQVLEEQQRQIEKQEELIVNFLMTHEKNK